MTTTRKHLFASILTLLLIAGALWPAFDSPTTIEWTFTPHPDGTFVTIVNHGFSGDDEALLSQVADSTEGFTLVLAGLKALLEHGVRLNLVADRFPKDAASG